MQTCIDRTIIDSGDPQKSGNQKAACQHDYRNPVALDELRVASCVYQRSLGAEGKNIYYHRNTKA